MFLIVSMPKGHCAGSIEAGWQPSALALEDCLNLRTALLITRRSIAIVAAVSKTDPTLSAIMMKMELEWVDG